MTKFILAALIGISFTVTGGEDYWQQKLAYDIQASLNPDEKTIDAHLQLAYVNNSPDTLYSIYFHCWPNAYSSKHTPLLKQLVSMGDQEKYFEAIEEPGSLSGLNFLVNDQAAKHVELDEFGEVVLLQLNQALLPGMVAVIKTNFKVQMPRAGVSRLGYLNDDFYVSQWFPKPAVYDKDGWHVFPYLDQGEFYSEFGDFRVQIDVPKGYLVAASGERSSATEGYEESLKAKIKEFCEAEESDTLVLDTLPLDDSSISTRDTIVYKIKNAHDFAWFTSPEFQVMEKEVLLPGKADPVKLEAYFKWENSDLWSNSLKFTENALLFYSSQLGDYPYSSCTVVDGPLGAGGGMEYPSITIVETFSNESLLEEVIVHEVGHNWFYGILANNERSHPWMDEGLNSCYESMYMNSDYTSSSISGILGSSGKRFVNDIDDRFYLVQWYSYAMDAARSLDQKGNLKAAHYKNDAYGSVVYSKYAVVFNYLRNYIGNEAFKNFMSDFYKEWMFKHPSPDDFFQSLSQFEMELNSDLEETTWDMSWLKGLLYSDKEMDYALRSVQSKGDSLKLYVDNESELEAPLLIDVIKGDSIVSSIWVEGFVGKGSVSIPIMEYDRIEIDADHISPEINRSNNTYYNTWLLPKSEPLSAQLLLGPDIQFEKELIYVPMVGYTSNDQFKIGVLLYNSSLKQKDLRYLLVPTYSFGPNKVGGYYQLIKSFDIDEHNSEFSVNLKLRRDQLNHRFVGGHFQKIEPSVSYVFNQTKKENKKLSLRYLSTSIQFPEYQGLNNQYWICDFEIDRQNSLLPFTSSAKLEYINYDFAKLSMAWKQSFYLNGKLDKVDLRLFAGVTIGDGDLQHRWRMTSGSGSDGLLAVNGEIVSLGGGDYTYDEVLLSRYNNPFNALSQQVLEAEGGFRTGLVLGANTNWLSAANITMPTPLSFVNLYGDVGFFPGFETTENAYSVGVELCIVDDIFEFYFPLHNSENINANFDAVGMDSYAQQIRFKLSLGELHRIWD